MAKSNQADGSEFVDPLSDYEPTEYASELERALAEETVATMKIQPFVELSPSTKICDAVKTLHNAQVTSALVVDDQQRLLGVFTERDVLERVAERFQRVADCPISDVMTANPTVVYESDPAAAALAAIAIAGHRHVPVLSMNEKVMGLINPRRAFDFVETHDQ